MKLNVGPGNTASFFKNLKEWEMLDCEKSRVKSPEMIIDFNNFKKISRKDNYYDFVYASHVLEHIHPLYTVSFLREVKRVMKKDAILRIVIPDAVKSMKVYLDGQSDSFSLFSRRKKKYSLHNKKSNNYIPMTNFEAMKGCFISVTSQPVLVAGKVYRPFAHQNAWDFESLVADLKRGGFEEANIFKSEYTKSISGNIDFEKNLDTEARQFERSLYVEVKK